MERGASQIICLTDLCVPWGSGWTELFIRWLSSGESGYYMLPSLADGEFLIRTWRVCIDAYSIRIQGQACGVTELCTANSSSGAVIRPLMAVRY